MRHNGKSAPISTPELKRRLPAVDVVATDLYGIEFRNDAARCPFPQSHAHGDRDPSLRYDKRKDRLFCASQNCFGEKGADAIGLVRRMERCSFPEAVQKLVDHYSVQIGRDGQNPPARHNGSRARTPKTSEDEQPIPAEKVRAGLSRRGFHAVAEFEYGSNLRKVRFEHDSARQADKDRAEKTLRWEHCVDGAWYSGDGGIPKYIDREPDEAAEQQAKRIFRRLLELDSTGPVLFRFEPEAQKLLVEWLEGLEAKVRGDELHPALVSHLSKYRSLMPSLALLFELADRASSDGFVGAALVTEEKFISLQHAQQAADWCEYLESHARRVYSCVVTPQLRSAQELANKIKRRKVGADGLLSCRDVYLKGWSGLDTPEAVKQAAEVLEDAGWLRELTVESGRFGGRPSNRYQVNPRVWE